MNDSAEQSATIVAILEEERTFDPPEEFAEKATIRDSSLA